MLADAADDQAMQSTRRGSGEIRVEEVELLVDGQPTTHVRTGDTVDVRLHFASDETIENPVFAITIGRLGGAIVTFPSSRDTGDVPATISGSGTVEVRLADIALIPGPHVLHTEVTGFGRQHVFDHIQNAVSFDVLAGDVRETAGIMTMRPTWALSGPGVSGPSPLV